MTVVFGDADKAEITIDGKAYGVVAVERSDNQPTPTDDCDTGCGVCTLPAEIKEESDIYQVASHSDTEVPERHITVTDGFVRGLYAAYERPAAESEPKEVMVCREPGYSLGESQQGIDGIDFQGLKCSPCVVRVKSDDGMTYLMPLACIFGAGAASSPDRGTDRGGLTRGSSISGKRSKRFTYGEAGASLDTYSYTCELENVRIFFGELVRDRQSDGAGSPKTDVTTGNRDFTRPCSVCGWIHDRTLTAWTDPNTMKRVTVRSGTNRHKFLAYLHHGMVESMFDVPLGPFIGQHCGKGHKAKDILGKKISLFDPTENGRGRIRPPGFKRPPGRPKKKI